MKPTSQPPTYYDIINIDDDSIVDAYLYSAESYSRYAKLLHFNSHMDTDFESLSDAETYTKRYFPELLL